MTPQVLLSVVDAINNDARTYTDSSWFQHSEEEWSLRFTACLSVPETDFMPLESVWHLVVWATLNGEVAQVYPDATHGISA